MLLTTEVNKWIISLKSKFIKRGKLRREFDRAAEVLERICFLDDGEFL
jgi:hypothetical protein